MHVIKPYCEIALPCLALPCLMLDAALSLHANLTEGEASVASMASKCHELGSDAANKRQQWVDESE